MSVDRIGHDLLAGMVDRLAGSHPVSVAGYHGDGSGVSFAEMAALADDVSRALPDGVRRVGVRIPNRLAGVAAVHGVWRRGASVVLIPAVLPDEEMERRLVQTGAEAVVELGEGAPAVRRLPGRPEALEGEAAMVFTSGTTGRPKAAVLGFAGLAGSVTSIAEAIGLPDGRPPADPPRPPTPVFMPLAHVGGFLATLTAMYQGKPVVVFDKFRVDEVFDLVDRFDLTMLRLAPAMLFDLATWPGDRTLGRVRSVSVGSAPLSEELRDRFESRYGAVVLQSYGLTELAGAVAFERYEDARAGRRRPGTVGRIAPGVEVRIVAGDRDAEPGEPGEILARGPSRFLAYIDGDGTTLPAPAGWVRTGDLGCLDTDGFLTVLGRADDMILCGGFNIYPAVVQAALNRLPDVVDSAVVGLPDDRLGQIPVAVVAVDGDPADPEELRAGLRDHLAPYEIPRRITAVRRLPLTAGGKPDRQAIQRLFDG